MTQDYDHVAEAARILRRVLKRLGPKVKGTRLDRAMHGAWTKTLAEDPTGQDLEHLALGWDLRTQIAQTLGVIPS